MYVKTSFFDVEHEVKKDSFFISAGKDIFFLNNVHYNFFRNLMPKSSRSIFSSPKQSRVNAVLYIYITHIPKRTVLALAAKIEN